MKIFCVGFQKTGTKSMGDALAALGYRVVGCKGANDPRIAETAYELVERLVPKYDAFQDNPWAILYQHLDKQYPGSKFIMTVREPESWLKSAVYTFGNSSTPMREWIYGYGDPIGHEDVYLERYLRHNNEVMQYFSNRTREEFLVMDLAKGDGWSELCAFLGTEVREGPFHHRNSSAEKAKLKSKAKRAARKVRRRVADATGIGKGED